MPAEWEPQSGIWLTWPQNFETFGDFLPKVEKSYEKLIKIVSQAQTVHILVIDKPTQRKILTLLSNRGIFIENLKFHELNVQDVWIRDYGPIFLISDPESSPHPRIAMVDWIFNAWGNKYEDLKEDSIIPAKINEILRIPCWKPKFVLEGGSIEVNGKGSLMTTEQCLLNQNRNPNKSKEEIESVLKAHFGVTHIIWLNRGIEGDDTDGHIDDIARFVNPNTILFGYENNENDKNYEVLFENFNILKRAVNEKGEPFKIIPCPMPEPVIIEGMRLPASYLNFLIVNQYVIVPTFGQNGDARALDLIQECFPERKVIGINAKEMVYGLGTFHCCSQQMPLKE